MSTMNESSSNRFQRLPDSGHNDADPSASESIPKPHTPGSSPAHSFQGRARGEGEVHAMDIEEREVDAPAEFKHPIPLWKRRLMIFLFTLMASLLFADQNLLAPNLTEAAEYFGFDDEEKDKYLGGYIAAAFFAVGAPSALLMGILSDKYNRRNLLFIAVIIGETPCMCTYWVKTYGEFFFTRAMTGFAVGGCLPLLFSILGDLFPPQNRSTVSGFVQIATGAGVFVGQIMASWVGPRTNWKVPFLVASAPALVVATIIVLTIPEPPRGVCEEALQDDFAHGGSYSERITWRKSIAIFKIKSNWFIFLQGLPGSLPWGMVMVYFNDYLSQDKGFSIQFATLIISLFGAGGGIGVVGGAFLGQWLYNKKKEWMPVLAGTTVMFAIPPMMYLVNVDLQSESVVLTCAMAILGGLLASVAGPNLRAAMLNVNEPETRGVASALQTVTDDLGKALGPFFVAAFISKLGRQGAFNIAVAAWLPCGLLLLCLVFTMSKDEAAMQHRLELRAELRREANAAEGRDLQERFLPPSAPHSDSVTAASNPASTHDMGHGNGMDTVDAKLLQHNDSHLDGKPLTDGVPEPDPSSTPIEHISQIAASHRHDNAEAADTITEDELPGSANSASLLVHTHDDHQSEEKGQGISELIISPAGPETKRSRSSLRATPRNESIDLHR